MLYGRATMRRVLTSLCTLLLVAAATGPGPARAMTGVDEGKVLLDGGVMYSAHGASAGTYFARGLAEYLLSGHVGVRFEGYARFRDPALTPDLEIERSGAALGLVFHFNPQSWVDPYVLLNAGATFFGGERFTASPAVNAAAGLNVHIGRAFVNLQAGYHVGDAWRQHANPGVNDVRVQFGIGFAFDTAR